jgi:hypothetical protein
VASDAERIELTRLVAFLQAGDGSEAEQDAALDGLQARVPHPRVASLIFWPDAEGFDRELTPEEVVEIASAYRPVEL